MEKLLYFCTSVLSSLVNTGSITPRNPKRILLVKRDEIGDVIYTLHCFEAICAEFPQAEIILWCKPMNNSLVKQFTQIKPVNDAKAVIGHFDLQIDFRGNWQSLLWPLVGRSSYYLERGSTRFYHKLNGGQVHETKTNQQLIQPLFPDNYHWPEPRLIPTEEDKKVVDDLLAELGITEFVLMHAGARDKARRWPTERFKPLASTIYTNWGLPTVFIGASNEYELNTSIVRGLDYAHNLAGRTTLLQLSELANRCTFFVGNESGPMHFAVINKTPLVALFGPGVEHVFYPLYDHQHVIHHLEKQPAEVTDITVDEVTKVIELIVKN